MLSIVWTPRRGSQSYTEKRRGRKETEVTRRRKGGIKRKETDPATNKFPKCSLQPGTHKEIHRLGYRKQGGGGDRGDLVETKESQKGEESNQSSNHTPK